MATEVRAREFRIEDRPCFIHLAFPTVMALTPHTDQAQMWGLNQLSSVSIQLRIQGLGKLLFIGSIKKRHCKLDFGPHMSPL